MRSSGWLCVVVAVVGLLVFGAVSQAVVITVDPGAYGTYNEAGGSINVGRYSMNTVPFIGYDIFNDQTGVQTPDLGDGTYQIRARDANVIIGEITIAGGVITVSSGQITTGANTVDFINQEVILNYAAGWTDPCAALWNVAGSGQRFVKKFVMPAGAWGGWYGNVGRGNTFGIDLAGDGTVSIVYDTRGIGITGGNLQINFPDEIEEITLTISAKAPLMNWWNIDWVLGNQNPNNLTVNLKFYAGSYWFNEDSPGSFDDPYMTVPLDTVNWVHVKTFTENSTDYIWTFSGPVYTPPKGSVFWQK